MCISYLLLGNKLPQNSVALTTCIHYLTISAGQELGWFSLGFFTELCSRSWLTWVFIWRLGVGTRVGALTSVFQCLVSGFSSWAVVCWNPRFLLAVGWRSLSVPCHMGLFSYVAPSPKRANHKSKRESLLTRWRSHLFVTNHENDTLQYCCMITVRSRLFRRVQSYSHEYQEAWITGLCLTGLWSWSLRTR